MPSSSSMAHSRQASDVLPSHMRASNSGANLYVAPYERNQFESLTQEFGDFGLSSQTRRRESFPVSSLSVSCLFLLIGVSSLSPATIPRPLTMALVIQHRTSIFLMAMKIACPVPPIRISMRDHLTLVDNPRYTSLTVLAVLCSMRPTNSLLHTM